MRTDRRRIARLALMALALLAGPAALPARGQIYGLVGLGRTNRHLAGQVIDLTHNHGKDQRLFSPILGMPRDLYVYLPPGYDPCRAYPLILYLHMGRVDEHAFLGLPQLKQLDRMISDGEFPPAIVACPDGTIDGRNRYKSPHSLFINGVHGQYEDHILREVIPFLMQRFPIRPDRQAHALLGASAGGFGALTLAIRHRDFFGAVAGIAAPANLRYDNGQGDYRSNFDPATYRWDSEYDPDEIVGVFTLGLRRIPAKQFVAPVFGEGQVVAGRVLAVNPADLLFTSGLRPGELPIYLNYPERDNWNFDAQAESFAWLAAQAGISVTLECVPRGQHGLIYFATQHRPAYTWLARYLLPPTSPPAPQ